jgi:hypothetical protein
VNWLIASFPVLAFVGIYWLVSRLVNTKVENARLEDQVKAVTAATKNLETERVVQHEAADMSFDDILTANDRLRSDK